MHETTQCIATIGCCQTTQLQLRKCVTLALSQSTPCHRTQAAAEAAVDAAQHGRHGPTSIRVPSVSSGLGGHGGAAAGVQKQKQKKRKQKATGGAAPEVRKPPARVRRASARSESRDEEPDGYEVGSLQEDRHDSRNSVPGFAAWHRAFDGRPVHGVYCSTGVYAAQNWVMLASHQAATPDPLQRPGQGFAPPPKGAVGARPAGSAARAASSRDQVGGLTSKQRHQLLSAAALRYTMQLACSVHGEVARRPPASAAEPAWLSQQGGSSHAEPEAASAPPPGPEIPPGPPDIQRVMDKVQKRDLFHIFKEPVTDAMVRVPLCCWPVQLRAHRSSAAVRACSADLDMCASQHRAAVMLAPCQATL